MFYTSGTTGFPKVCGRYSRPPGGDVSMLELICAGFSDVLGLPGDGVTLLEGPMYHSAQWVFAMFPLLGRGSTVVMRHGFDVAETLDLIDRYEATNVHLAPTQFLRMLKLPDQGPGRVRRLLARGRLPRRRSVPRCGQAARCWIGGVRRSPSTTAAPRAGSSR